MTLIPTRRQRAISVADRTTEGGFFNRQSRRTERFDWQENYQFAPRQFLGAHRVKAGVDYSHSHFNGPQTFFPVGLVGSSGTAIETNHLHPPDSFNVTQNEVALYVSDDGSPLSRLTFTLGCGR